MRSTAAATNTLAWQCQASVFPIKRSRTFPYPRARPQRQFVPFQHAWHSVFFLSCPGVRMQPIGIPVNATTNASTWAHTTFCPCGSRASMAPNLPWSPSILWRASYSPLSRIRQFAVLLSRPARPAALVSFTLTWAGLLGTLPGSRDDIL